MSIYGSKYSKLLLEKKVPTDDNTDYTSMDEKPAGKNTSSEDSSYDLPADKEDPEPAKEDDDTSYDLPDDTTDDDTTTPEDGAEDDTTTDDTAEDDTTVDDTATDDTSADDGDYSLDGDTGDDSSTGDDTTDDAVSDDTAATDDTVEAEDPLDTLEKEIYKDLKPAQKEIRDKELGNLFMELFNSLSDIYTRIDQIPKIQDNLQVLEFASAKILEIKSILYKYISFTYSTKSYLENLEEYYLFITSIEGIKKLLSQIEQKEDNKNKQ